MRNDNLGDRMKTYENVTRTYLTRRTPIIIRIDGKDVQRSEWVIDNEIPIFSQNTWYVNGRITFDE